MTRQDRHDPAEPPAVRDSHDQHGIADSMGSPEPVGLSPEEAFSLLGHRTRLEILHALWEEQLPLAFRDFEDPPPGSPVPFTTLRKRVGMRDGSQFNYHLKKLVGPFVHATGDGYVLRRSGMEIMSAIRAGGLTDAVVFDEEPIGEGCPLCGEQVVLETGTKRTLDWLVCRCTSCEGGYEVPAFPPGILMLVSPLKPVGVRERTPDEMYRALVQWTHHAFRLVVGGVCPQCTGPVRSSPLICEDHVVNPGQVCDTCGTIFEIRFRCVCEICKEVWLTACDRHFVTHPTVHAFYHDHGYDPFGHGWLRIQAETITDQTIVSDDPLEIQTEILIDEDRLTVTLDETGTVVNVDG